MPFEVPAGWVWCRLGDVFSHNTGKALNASNKDGENLTYITTSNVYWDRFELNDLKKMPFTDSELEKCTVTKGDLLVCEGGDIGRSAIWNFDYNIRIQNHIHRLRPISEANVHFYYYVLMYNKEAGLIGGKGIGLMGLSSGELDKMIVPLPPIKEQGRIKDEIEKLFAIVSLIEKNERDLKDAVQKAKSKILDLALSGHLTSDTSHYPQLPQSRVARWASKTIDEIFHHNTGKALNKSDSDGELYDYITTSNLYWNKFDLSSVRKMKFKPSEIEKCSVRKGDLLICEGGDVGRAAVWNYDFNIMIQNHIHRLRCRLEANPKFYYYVMMYYKSKGMISGKGIGLMGLSSKELGKLQVPYPPIEEQNDIVTYLDNIIDILDSVVSQHSIISQNLQNFNFAK